ncbi:MAG TPA: hypothetical protein ENJ46_01960 [Hellea balneolensis]|uniref:Uncharacterized protein n=1 Tax=Hellea balneolensis TaxID=287478 RepID=A0A7C3C4T1_9PROT|nr:hypothetical protein [Hellea balneolensis]
MTLTPRQTRNALVCLGIGFAVSGCATVSSPLSNLSPDRWQSPAFTRQAAGVAYIWVPAVPAYLENQKAHPTPNSDATQDMPRASLLAQLRPRSAPDADIIRAQERTPAVTRARKPQSDLELAGG